MKKSLSILLASILLLSNIGYAVSTHYCGGEAVEKSISILQQDLDCGMEKMKSKCESLADMSIIKNKDCCENEQLTFSIEDDFNKRSVVEHTVNFQFIAAFVFTQIQAKHFETTKTNNFSNYVPFVLNLDIPIMVQSFLL